MNFWDKIYSRYILFVIFFVSALLRNNLFRTVYGIETMLYGAGMFFYLTQIDKISLKKLIPIIGIFSFLIINLIRGISSYGVSTSYFTFVGGALMICLLCYTINVRNTQFQKMLKAYVYGATAACLVLVLYYAIPSLNPIEVEGARYTVAGIDPNEFSVLINIALSIIIFTDLFKNKIRLALIPLYLFAILSTGSRTGFICLSTIMGIYLLTGKGSKIKRLFLISIICIVGIFVLNTYVSENASERLLSLGESRADVGDADGLSGRSYIWADAYRIWEEASSINKIFGYGINTFAKLSIFHLEPHNVFIKTIIECGIIGFIILLCLLYKVFRHGLHAQNKRLFFTIFIILLMSFMTLSWIYNPTTSLIFCFLLLFRPKSQLSHE